MLPNEIFLSHSSQDQEFVARLVVPPLHTPCDFDRLSWVLARFQRIIIGVERSRFSGEEERRYRFALSRAYPEKEKPPAIANRLSGKPRRENGLEVILPDTLDS